MTPIGVSGLNTIGSDNGLSPERRQAIIWASAGILWSGSLGPNFSGILLDIYIFFIHENASETSSAKWRPFCIGLNVLINIIRCNKSTASMKLNTDRTEVENRTIWIRAINSSDIFQCSLECAKWTNMRFWTHYSDIIFACCIGEFSVNGNATKISLGVP